MKLPNRRLLCVASVALCGGICAASAHAQTQVFGSGIGTYAMLNGDNLTLYLDQLGDVGAPRQSSGTVKPGGSLNGSNQPNINPNGSIAEPYAPGAPIDYGMLYNINSQASAGSLQASIQNKYEYETLGTLFSQEGWGVKVGTTWHAYSAAVATAAPVVSGGTINSPIAATTDTTFTGSNLNMSQSVSFNTVGRYNIAQFTTTFTNTGSSNITGLQYDRYINPQQDEGPGGGATKNTLQSFGTTNDPNLFGINSKGATSLRNLALGVHASAAGTDLNAGGSTIFAISGTTSELNALTAPTAQLNGVNYVQLAASGLGASYFTSGNHLDATTTDWQTNPFLTPGNVTVNPAFSSNSTDNDLELLSPLLGTAGQAPGVLLPGANNAAEYTFYYVFDIPAAVTPPPTPEPGTMALLVGSGLAVFSARFRSRRARK